MIISDLLVSLSSSSCSVRRSNLLLSARESLALALREVLVMWWEKSEESLRLIKTGFHPEVEQFVVMLDVLKVEQIICPILPFPALQWTVATW